MSRPAGPARRAWERHKAAAFPPGALTFHLDAWTHRRLTPEARAAAAEVLARYRFEDLLVVHGSALLDRGGVTLVTGPPSIGKSSTLRDLDAAGLGRLVEDGLVLVGIRGGRWHLLVTGTLDVQNRSSRIGGRLRRLIGVRTFFHHGAAPSAHRRRSPIRLAILPRLSNTAFTLATAFGRRPDGPFTPTCHEVRALVVVPHPEDPARSVRLCGGGGLEVVPDLLALAPAGVATLSVCPFDTLEEVRHRLREAILSVREGEPDERRPG